MDARRFQSVWGLLLVLSFAVGAHGQFESRATQSNPDPSMDLSQTGSSLPVAPSFVDADPGFVADSTSYSESYFPGSAPTMVMPPSMPPVAMSYPVTAQPMMQQPMMVHPLMVQPMMGHPNVVHASVLPANSPPIGSVVASHLPFNAEPRIGRAARGSARQPAVANSENFIVFASDTKWASEVAEMAEQQRRDLAIYWLGRELPAWPQRCPLHVQDAPNLGAGGETRFALSRGVAGSWMMSVQGTRQRILDSVLPHEITHTIFATHFGKMNKYVPRWADEGASTTVEHDEEKKKHRHFLHQFLKTGRGLAFNEMFRLKEYPQDILPLYAQGHSAVQFLLDQAGPRQFIQFIETGMMTENWPTALQKFYAYQSIGDFQINWNQWLRDGSPADLASYSPLVRQQSTENILLASGISPSKSVTPPSPSTSASTLADSESWFQRKLHETSGTPATSIPPHNHFSGDPAHGLRSSGSATRPQAAQSQGIQVLDSGDAGRISSAPDATGPFGLVR